MIPWPLVLLLAAAAWVGLCVWTLVVWWPEWRGRLTETREERRRQRSRNALRRADRLVDEGHPHKALIWAHRAHRLNPSNPRVELVRGLALSVTRRYELALKHLEAGYGLIEPDSQNARRGTQEGLEVDLAMAAARCCARLRLDAHDALESEAWAEQVLSWANVAVRKDPLAVDVLVHEPLLRDLRGQVRILHAGDQWDVRP